MFPVKFALPWRKGWSHLVFTGNQWRRQWLPIWRPENWTKLMDALLVRPKLHFNALHPLFTRILSNQDKFRKFFWHLFLVGCCSWIIYSFAFSSESSSSGSSSADMICVNLLQRQIYIFYSHIILYLQYLCLFPDIARNPKRIQKSGIQSIKKSRFFFIILKSP